MCYGASTGSEEQSSLGSGAVSAAAPVQDLQPGWRFSGSPGGLGAPGGPGGLGRPAIPLDATQVQAEGRDAGQEEDQSQGEGGRRLPTGTGGLSRKHHELEVPQAWWSGGALHHLETHQTTSWRGGGDSPQVIVCPCLFNSIVMCACCCVHYLSVLCSEAPCVAFQSTNGADVI